MNLLKRLEKHVYSVVKGKFHNLPLDGVLSISLLLIFSNLTFLFDL